MLNEKSRFQINEICFSRFKVHKQGDSPFVVTFQYPLLGREPYLRI